MTARTRRRWQPEEKLAVIKEVQEKGSVVETCRKYSIDPAMYYRWKASYDTFGVDGLKSHYRRMEPGLRKLMKENSRLKKLLAEKDLTVEMLSEALKKKGGWKRDEHTGIRICGKGHQLNRGRQSSAHSEMHPLQNTCTIAFQEGEAVF